MINDEQSVALTQARNDRGNRWLASGGRKGILLLTRDDHGTWSERIQIRGTPGEILSLQASSKRKGQGIAIYVGLHTDGGFRIKLQPQFLQKSLRSDSTLSVPFKKLKEGKGKGIRATSFTGDGSERKGLPHGEIQFFLLRDRVVAGTDSGLFRLRRESGKDLAWIPDTSLGCLFGKCPNKKGKKPQNVFRLQEGKHGWVWIQSKKQAYRVFPEQDVDHRIDSTPFKGIRLGTVRGFHPDSNGVTWVTGDNGLLRYDENVEKEFKRDYACLIRKVSVPLSDPDRNKKDSVLFAGTYRKPAPDTSLLKWERTSEQPEQSVPTLPYRSNGISFHFASPYFEGRESLEYSYKLKGFDKEWSEWKRETRKEYTNLPEGNYRFMVKARNVYGIESEPTTYRFRILPPWYRTWIAYSGYSIAGMGLIALLLWLNSRRLLGQKERLERIVEERTRDIREQQKETERQKERVEEAHREITASIDYAQKIQNALLRSEVNALDHLPEHFILFKPQATVSGDFYWIREQGGYLYFAIVDCTGHGVPGAFMSMLGISQLNEILSLRGTPRPGAVLSELRERVVSELNSGKFGEKASDGMDAALIRIPLQTSSHTVSKKVEFAGANNPLYVVKKGIGQTPPQVSFYRKGEAIKAEKERVKAFKKNPDGIEVKGDKMAVGYEADTENDFATAELEVPADAMLYLFSDGFADQFGGPKGKKFRYGPFRDLLASIHPLSTEEQKEELEKAFEEWKAGQEQVDDVCVAGIRTRI